MTAAAPQKMAQAPQRPSMFRELTRQQIYPINPLILNTFGNSYSVTLEKTGYLARLWDYVTGTVTIPTTPSGSWASYPPLPWAAIRRAQVYTTQGQYIVDCTGWGLALWELTNHRLSDFQADPIAYLNANTRSLMLTYPSGTLAAGNAAFQFPLKIPVMSDDATMLGLLPLQIDNVGVQHIVTAPLPSDLVASGATAPTAINLSVQPTIEYFSVPASPADQPNQSWVHQVVETIVPIANSGDVTVNLDPGPVYTKLVGILENNGAQMSPSQINYIKLVYASNIAPYYEPYANHLIRHKHFYGQYLPDGAFALDLTLGSGLPDIDDPRDYFDSSRMSAFKLVVNVSGSLTNAQLRLIQERLIWRGGA